MEADEVGEVDEKIMSESYDDFRWDSEQNTFITTSFIEYDLELSTAEIWKVVEAIDQRWYGFKGKRKTFYWIW